MHAANTSEPDHSNAEETEWLQVDCAAADDPELEPIELLRDIQRNDRVGLTRHVKPPGMQDPLAQLSANVDRGLELLMQRLNQDFHPIAPGLEVTVGAPDHRMFALQPPAQFLGPDFECPVPADLRTEPTRGENHLFGDIVLTRARRIQADGEPGKLSS